MLTTQCIKDFIEKNRPAIKHNLATAMVKCVNNPSLIEKIKKDPDFNLVVVTVDAQIKITCSTHNMGLAKKLFGGIFYDFKQYRTHESISIRRGNFLDFLSRIDDKNRNLQKKWLEQYQQKRSEVIPSTARVQVSIRYDSQTHKKSLKTKEKRRKGLLAPQLPQSLRISQVLDFRTHAPVSRSTYGNARKSFTVPRGGTSLSWEKRDDHQYGQKPAQIVRIQCPDTAHSAASPFFGGATKQHQLVTAQSYGAVPKQRSLLAAPLSRQQQLLREVIDRGIYNRIQGYMDELRPYTTYAKSWRERGGKRTYKDEKYDALKAIVDMLDKGIFSKGSISEAKSTVDSSLTGSKSDDVKYKQSWNFGVMMVYSVVGIVFGALYLAFLWASGGSKSKTELLLRETEKELDRLSKSLT